MLSLIRLRLTAITTVRCGLDRRAMADSSSARPPPFLERRRPNTPPSHSIKNKTPREPPPDFAFLRHPVKLSDLPEQDFETVANELGSLSAADWSLVTSRPERKRLYAFRAVFAYASRLSVDERTVYFNTIDAAESIDARHRAFKAIWFEPANKGREPANKGKFAQQTTAPLDPRERAIQQVESGSFVHEDALDMDEWDRGLAAREKALVDKLMAIPQEQVAHRSMTREQELKATRAGIARLRTRALLRREIIRERLQGQS